MGGVPSCDAKCVRTSFITVHHKTHLRRRDVFSIFSHNRANQYVAFLRTKVMTVRRSRTFLWRLNNLNKRRECSSDFPRACKSEVPPRTSQVTVRHEYKNLDPEVVHVLASRLCNAGKRRSSEQSARFVAVPTFIEVEDVQDEVFRRGECLRHTECLMFVLTGRSFRVAAADVVIVAVRVEPPHVPVVSAALVIFKAKQEIGHAAFIVHLDLAIGVFTRLGVNGRKEIGPWHGSLHAPEARPRISMMTVDQRSINVRSTCNRAGILSLSHHERRRHFYLAQQLPRLT